jgi:hypothetical protein
VQNLITFSQYLSVYAESHKFKDKLLNFGALYHWLDGQDMFVN